MAHGWPLINQRFQRHAVDVEAGSLVVIEQGDSHLPGPVSTRPVVLIFIWNLLVTWCFPESTGQVLLHQEIRAGIAAGGTIVPGHLRQPLPVDPGFKREGTSLSIARQLELGQYDMVVPRPGLVEAHADQERFFLVGPNQLAPGVLLVVR